MGWLALKVKTHLMLFFFMGSIEKLQPSRHGLKKNAFKTADTLDFHIRL